MKIVSVLAQLEEFGIVVLTVETQYLLCHTAMRVTARAAG